MPESRDDALDVLTHLMRKMGLKEFYQLLEEIHRHNRHGGKSASASRTSAYCVGTNGLRRIFWEAWTCSARPSWLQR